MIQNIQRIAAWVASNQNVVASLVATFPQSLDGLLPGQVYWDGTTLSKAPEDPSTYPTSATGLYSGDVYYSDGAYHVVA